MDKINSKTVNITIPAELLKQVDELAKRDYTSPSDVIRQALLERIRKPQVDEWGDAGHWETIVDFHDLPNGGMPADEFMSRLKALDGQDQ